MLFILGSILTGALLYDYYFANNTEEDTQTETYNIKSGNGELNLPPCRLMAVGLGPSTNPKKATLQIMMNKSLETEAKPVINIETEAKYVKLTPTQYQTNIVLKTKKKSEVPITAYYSVAGPAP